MKKNNTFVANNTVRVDVTPAQQKLLELITPSESITYYKSLKVVHENSLFNLIDGMEDLQASFSTQLLLDAIHRIYSETIISRVKNNSTISEKCDW